MSRPEPDPRAAEDGDLGRFELEGSGEGWFERLRAAEAPRVLGSIGPYELLEEVSRGGQGVVFRARQPGTKREIAIKRLLAGSLASPATRRRFEREIEAATALNHPNVVTIYGVEIVDGQPLLAMEWIDGVAVTEWVHAAKPARDLLLGVFVAICDGVTHAHQHGVIHRDLKPSNILVDAAGVPHVLDFGLAKRFGGVPQSEPTLTLPDGFAGTPAYASPEQIRGGAATVDVRSDVYSLGVVLYEMLTARLPFPGDQSVTKMLLAIELSEPKAPSSLVRGLARDLDTIVLKALAKGKEQRYATVDALAADVRRFLSGAAILAHPPSAWYQVRTFVRRRWLPVSFAATVFALVVGFAIFSLLQARRLQIEKDNAERLAKRSSAVLGFFAEDVLGRRDPWELGHVPTLEDALGGGAGHISARFADEPADAALVHQLFASLYLGLGRLREAEIEINAALTLEKGTSTDVLVRRNERLRLLAELHIANMRWRDAATLLQAQLKDTSLPDEARARSLFLLARASRIGARYAIAAKHLDDLIGLHRKLYGLGSIEVVRDLHELAIVQTEAADLRGAQQSFDAALTALERLGPEWERYAASLSCDRAALDRARGDLETARKHLADGLSVLRKVFGSEHIELASPLANLAAIDLERGELATARPELEELERIAKKSLGEDHPRAAELQLELAALLRLQGRTRAAVELLRDAGQRFERRLGFNNPRVAEAKEAEAEARFELALAGEPGERDEIVKLFEDALENRSTILGDDHPSVAESEEAIGRVQWKLVRNAASAEQHFEKARASLKASSARPALLAKVESELAQLRREESR